MPGSTTLHTVTPLRCPHCWQPLPPPVSARTLEAARIIRSQPGEQGTGEDVARELGITRRAASALLATAERAGLVSASGTRPNARGMGGAQVKVYRAEALIAAYEHGQEEA